METARIAACYLYLQAARRAIESRVYKLLFREDPCTYLIPHSWIPLEKITVTKPVKICTKFCRKWFHDYVHKRPLNPTVYRWLHSKAWNYITLTRFNNILSSESKFSEWSVSSRISYQNPAYSSSPCLQPNPPLSYFFDHRKSTLQIMKILTREFSPASCCFVLLTSNHLTQ